MKHSNLKAAALPDTLAEAGLAHARRATGMTWLARLWLAALGQLLAAAGVTLALLGLVPALFGLEQMLTAINDERSSCPPASPASWASPCTWTSRRSCR